MVKNHVKSLSKKTPNSGQKPLKGTKTLHQKKSKRWCMKKNNFSLFSIQKRAYYLNLHMDEQNKKCFGGKQTK